MDPLLFDAIKEQSQLTVPKKSESKVEREARQKAQLESRLASGDLDDTRTRVAFVLNQYPNCRNSDVELALRFWRMFDGEHLGRDSISFDALRQVTSMSSIIRARATIQNTFRLFVAEEAVSEFRDEKQRGVRKKQRAAARATLPVVHIYSDESGKSGKADKFYIVGSVWINDSDDQVLKLFQGLNAWRKEIGWEREFHFAEMSSTQRDTYVGFIRRAKESSEYVGFKAVVLARDDVKQRWSDDVIFELYYRLIVEGIAHERDTGRFTLPRSVEVRKDEDEGSDRLHLYSLRDKLRTECPKQFHNQIEISGVNPLSSKKNVLMQLADVFTGALNRVLNRPNGMERKYKDIAAEEMLGLLGISSNDVDGGIKRDFAHIIRL